MKKGNKNRRNVQKKVSYNDDNMLLSLFKIVLVLVVIFGLFYGLTVLRTMDKNKDTEKEAVTEIQYDEIMIGTILNQTANEYYVLVSDLSDVGYSKYKVYVDDLKEDVRIYTSDIENVFNRSYAGESNAKKYVNKTSIKGILFGDDTLLHVKRVKNKKGNKVNKIIDVFVGDEEILKKFSELVKSK